MEWVRLGDLVDIKTGKLNANAAVLNGKYPFFTTAQEISFIDSYSYDDEVVLVAGNGDLNVKYYEGKFDAYQRTYMLTKKENAKINLKFLYFFMSDYVKILRNQSIGGVIKYIKLENLTEAKIPLLSLSEQINIVDLLNNAERLKKIRKEQIQACDDLIESLLKKLISNPENKKILLDKFLEEITAGKSLAGKDKTFYKVLKTSCVFTGHFDDTEWKYLPKDYMPQEKHIIKEGDILVSRMNTSELVGASVYVYKDYEDLTVPDRLWILKLKNNISKIYLWKFFQTNFYRNQIQNISTGTSGSMKNISQKNFRKLEVIYPPIELQNKFADYVLKIEEEKKKLNESLLELEGLFDSLMEDAFSGNLFKN